MGNARMGAARMASKTWRLIRKAGRLYASSAHMNAVFIFDLNGNRIGSLDAKATGQLEGPSALALVDRKLYVLNMFGNGRVMTVNSNFAAIVTWANLTNGSVMLSEAKHS